MSTRQRTPDRRANTPSGPDEPLDIEAWRGIASEENSERTAAEATDRRSVARLRSRSMQLLGSLVRPHRRILALAVVLLLVQDVATMAGPFLVQVGIDRGIPPLRDHHSYAVLVSVGVAFLVASGLGYLTKRAFLMLSGRIGQSILFDLRRRVYKHFQKLSLSFHERYTSGRMIARLTSDMDSISEMVDNGIDDLVLAGLNVLSVAVILLFLDWPLALVTLCSFPFLLWLSAWFRNQSARAYRKTRETVSLVIVHFVESLGGIRAVHAYRREPRNQEIFEAVNHEYKRANQRAFRLIAIFSPGIKLIGNVTIAVVLTYGGYRVLHGQAEIGVLAAFVLYLRKFFEPMQDLSMFYNSLQSATAALEKLAGVLDEKPDVAEPATPHELTAARGELRFEAVQFGYRADRLVLPELNLTLPAGQTVAVVGATGAGKTTIAKLVSRFYDPTAGRVALDGVDLREVSEVDLRRAVVMVTQENFLFSGTVRENIAFGKPDATDEEIERAARAIGAHEFIAALPDGYGTDVAKGGGRLSAGQRQLVAFARAFLADPAVLILDEATSSLDIPSERLVQRALRTILADRTAIVIAHRLSTVEIADRVLVLDAGIVVEDGTPAQLIDGDGRYADLHRQWEDSLV
ncbi:ABC transporter ATP-binding protein [Actinocatenispora sera]|uniref:ABC transporter ATP-binding protein n=1 Tax=Actinocatenispora sera TaxID=390989 RepID=A0A810KUH8_9ACTN|nr:ABC transporter ATP-binding protein [Actinocatenispora sera]BCJ26009.1 ABC transporter ATP-binding protein [Actinocatenispora sera]